MPESKSNAGSAAQGVVAGWTLADLRQCNIDRQADWCPDQVPDLSFRGNELGGEVGEALNVIKKLERERHGWRGSRDTLEHLAEELADVVICADLAALTAGVDLMTAVKAKFDATSEKVGLPHRLSASPSPEALPASGAEVALDAALRDALAGGTGVVVTRLDPGALAKPASEPAGGRVENGEPCAFVDCPPGLFRWNGLLCFKSEYSTKAGQPDAYCVDSGEYFWGGTNGDLEKRCALIVTPIAALSSPASSLPAEAEALPAGVDVEPIISNVLFQVSGQYGGCPRFDWYELRNALVRALSSAPAPEDRNG